MSRGNPRRYKHWIPETPLQTHTARVKEESAGKQSDWERRPGISRDSKANAERRTADDGILFFSLQQHQ